ncbi:DoxX family protein [Streptomyces sp. N35]|uniref:DoxX family protein n=1 Tax=Streptomyces sp. N35 TaxID=2795730 RepID=UPI0018F7644E|nr:DoxX family protein [Streptomyces sp. N35]
MSPTADSDRTVSVAISLFRIVVGLLFACHGVASLFGTFGTESVASGAWPDWYAAVIHLVAGALVFFGLFTRPAALISSGAMAYAYFTVHQPDGLLPIQNGGEPAALFCWALLLLVFIGPGSLSFDRVLRARRKKR